MQLSIIKYITPIPKRKTKKNMKKYQLSIKFGYNQDLDIVSQITPTSKENNITLVPNTLNEKETYNALKKLTNSYNDYTAKHETIAALANNKNKPVTKNFNVYAEITKTPKGQYTIDALANTTKVIKQKTKDKNIEPEL